MWLFVVGATGGTFPLGSGHLEGPGGLLPVLPAPSACSLAPEMGMSLNYPLSSRSHAALCAGSQHRQVRARGIGPVPKRQPTHERLSRWTCESLAVPTPCRAAGTGACSVGCRHLSNEAPPLLSSDCAELWELNMALASRLNAPNIRPETQLLTLICAESY